jgi:surface antigen
VQRELQIGNLAMTPDRSRSSCTGKSLRRVAFWLLWTVIPGAVLASNLGFLKDAPITRFTGPDLALYETNLTQALTQTADGDVRRWANPETGSGGEIALIKTFEQDGKRCRRTRITNRARGYAEATTDAVFCREADGKWKVLAPSTPVKK